METFLTNHRKLFWQALDTLLASFGDSSRKRVLETSLASFRDYSGKSWRLFRQVIETHLVNLGDFLRVFWRLLLRVFETFLASLVDFFCEFWRFFQRVLKTWNLEDASDGSWKFSSVFWRLPCESWLWKGNLALVTKSPSNSHFYELPPKHSIKLTHCDRWWSPAVLNSDKMTHKIKKKTLYYLPQPHQ